MLYSFGGGGDGALPHAPPISDSAGNLFGTTQGGGSANLGVVYKLDARGKETALHSFGGGEDGAYTAAVLTRDASGNLYGTTWAGGGSCTFSGIGCGTVFELDPAGHESVLHRFIADAGGGAPSNSLLRDTRGNLFGTSAQGGISGGCGGAGCGIIFKLDVNGNETVLYTFKGGADGTNPASGLTADSHGNLYGVAAAGGNFSPSGCSPIGCGVAFELAANGSESVVHAFVNRYFGDPDGRVPVGDLVIDSAGNIYGTTEYGGAYDWGVVFKIAPNGNETILHTFTGGADGATPRTGVVRDAAGNLYGTTLQGGTGCGLNCGVVFKIDTAGRFSVIHNFNGPDGAYPEGGLTLSSSGKLYGTTSQGGAHVNGVVFELTP